MLELTKTSTTGKYIEVSIKIPCEEQDSGLADLLFDSTKELLKTLGKEVREVVDSSDEDDERLYSFEEVFPNSHPGSRLRGLRTREDLTQKALAELLGLKPHHISEMESGKRSIGKEMAKRLIAVLGGDYRVLL